MINANKTPQIRPIPGYPDYYATEDGDILSGKKKNGTLLKRKLRVQNSGYLYVSMTSGKTRPTTLTLPFHIQVYFYASIYILTVNKLAFSKCRNRLWDCSIDS